jgi:glycosyltransferase involved in cell wall biosynthesis
LYEELVKYTKVNLWSEYTPAPKLLNKYPIKIIRPKRFQFPLTGTFIIVGTYFYIGRWIKFASPRRIILIYNLFEQDNLLKQIDRLSKGGKRKIEIVYASEGLKNLTGLDGIVHESLINIKKFIPQNKVLKHWNNNEFTVGRMSRDVIEKHNIQDLKLYERLLAKGIRVRIMGGTCLNGYLKEKGIELLECNQENPVDFMHTLDCYYYRTSENIIETFGRTVAEAMACRLPVVCDARGQYSEFIHNRQNGFLINNNNNNNEAFEIIMNLVKNRELRERIGREARITMERIYSGENVKKMIEYYLE